MPIEENQEHVAAPTSADNVSQSSMENSKTQVFSLKNNVFVSALIVSLCA